MLLPGDCRSIRPRRNWERMIVSLAICGLTISLATRTFRLTYSVTTVVKSVASQPMRPHMDRDAANWIPPVPVIAVFDLPVFYPRFAPTGPPVQRLFLDESLSNRPPPFLVG